MVTGKPKSFHALVKLVLRPIEPLNREPVAAPGWLDGLSMFSNDQKLASHSCHELDAD